MRRQLRLSLWTPLILLLLLWRSGTAQAPVRPTGALTVFAAALALSALLMRTLLHRGVFTAYA